MFNMRNRFSRKESSTILILKFWFVNILFWKSLGKSLIYSIDQCINVRSMQHQSYQF